MEDAKEVEFFIAKLNQEGQPSFSIADQLLKLWKKNEMPTAAKLVAGRYCLLNGFYGAVIGALKRDLSERKPLCWPLVFDVVKNENPELVEALLLGAYEDENPLSLALAALNAGHPDLRWKKILDTFKAKTNHPIHETNPEARKGQVIAPSPEANQKLPEIDFETAKKAQEPQEIKSEALPQTQPSQPVSGDAPSQLKYLREKFPVSSFQTEEMEKPEWTELEVILRTKSKNWNLETCYEMSIGLSEMGLHELAMKVLKRHKKNWTPRERLLNIEFLLRDKLFLEALSECQDLLPLVGTQEDQLYCSLYYLAIAHDGLNDRASALGILKGIQSQIPGYRNIDNLIKQWESKP